MGTYFHGNPHEIQASQEGLQTLVLMNPTTYVQFSDTNINHQPPPSNNLVFLNSTTTSLSHAPPPNHQFVGIPLDPSNSHDPTSATLHGLVPRIHYSLYNPLDPSTTARDAARAQQGALSLSLSSQQQQLGLFGSSPSSQAQPVTSGSGLTNALSSSSSGMQLQGSVLLSSKYLKAVQELLDEVVSVNNNDDNYNGSEELSKKGNNGVSSNSNSKVVGESAGDVPAGDGSATGKRGAELTTAERQEIQMKKAKLINMLDEVEQRYRQYHHQMHIVMTTFEQAAGVGSAKTYTALALKTISKKFRCLKDAITGQIKAANKSLGEEDCLGGKVEGSSRLKFVDHHFRQQRAIQQLGMIQPNAWRPQRGLPERSVSVLRAWLFEHFLHPYPKDSDKHMLAKQTGLTRSQVSNWFINARVRLWKPMVEEMYVEELKEQEQNGSEDKTNKSEQNEDSVSKTILQEKNLASDIGAKSSNQAANVAAAAAMSRSISTASPSPIGGMARNQSVFSLMGSSELEGITQASPKKPRGNDMMQSPTTIPSIDMDMKPSEPAGNDLFSAKFSNERQNRDGFSFIGGQNNFIGGFGQYPIGEIGRFDADQFAPRFSGNGVSLTLGLPDCENHSLSGAHQGFLPNQGIQLGRRVGIAEANEFGAINTTTSSHSSSNAYESVDIQNRKRFAPAQLLPDFVA